MNSSKPLRPLLHQNPPLMVRQKLRLDPNTRGPLLALGELEIVVRQHMRHDSLDLIAGEEAAGASVPAEAEAHALRVRRGVLHFAGALGVDLAELGEAEGVELVRVRVDFGVHGDGVGGDADGGVGGDDEAVGHLVVDVDHAFHGDWRRLGTSKAGF